MVPALSLQAAPVCNLRRIGREKADNVLGYSAIEKCHFPGRAIEHNHGARVSQFAGILHIPLLYPADQGLPRHLSHLQAEP